MRQSDITNASNDNLTRYIEILKTIAFTIFVALAAIMFLVPIYLQSINLSPMSVVALAFLYVLYQDAVEPPSWKCKINKH